MATNPYQAPEAPSPKTGKGSIEQRLARHFLAQRDGYSIAYVLRKSVWRFMFLLCTLVLVVIGFYVVDDFVLKGALLFCIGMLVGTVLRDIGLFGQMKRQWPFTRKIIDWGKVEAFAEGREPVDEGSGDLG